MFAPLKSSKTDIYSLRGVYFRIGIDDGLLEESILQQGATLVGSEYGNEDFFAPRGTK